MLRVRGLRVAYPGSAAVVKDAHLDVARGESVAVVGASGCGKSTLCAALLGILPESATISCDVAEFDGAPLFAAPGRVRRGLLGARIGAVFQDPRASLTPHLPLRSHFRDAAASVGRLPRGDVDARAIRLLEELAVPRAAERLDAYPHELSGGLCQRAALALALLHDPEFLVADEPTTALDPSVRMTLLRLLRACVRARGASVLVVTHDFGVVAGLADRVVVMDAGAIVESATVDEFFRRPRSPAGARLMAAARAAAAGDAPPDDAATEAVA